MLAGRLCSRSQVPALGAEAHLPGLASTAAVQSSGTQILLAGGAELHLFDTLGRHTGPALRGASGLDEGIPGIAYQRSSDGAVAMVGAGGPYTITLRGTAAGGAAQLRLMQLAQGAAVRSLTFETVPITATSQGTLVLPPAGLTAGMAMDFAYLPGWPVQRVSAPALLTGSASEDRTPPQAKIALNLATRQVTITASDEPGGSGVNRILYSLSGQEDYVEYGGSFVLPAGANHVYAVAVDRAGNFTVPAARAPESTWLPLLLGRR
jgi:hypothetical protein